jgi:hypothetical protein
MSPPQEMKQLQDLKQQLAEANARIEALEKENKGLKETTSASASGYNNPVATPLHPEINDDLHGPCARMIRTNRVHNFFNDDLMPDNIKCPISQQLIKTPVLCSDTFTYELTSLVGYFESLTESRRQALLNPNGRGIQGIPLQHLNLTLNRAVLGLIQDWREASNLPDVAPEPIPMMYTASPRPKAKAAPRPQPPIGPRPENSETYIRLQTISKSLVRVLRYHDHEFIVKVNNVVSAPVMALYNVLDRNIVNPAIEISDIHQVVELFQYRSGRKRFGITLINGTEHIDTDECSNEY